MVVVHLAETDENVPGVNLSRGRLGNTVVYVSEGTGCLVKTVACRQNNARRVLDVSCLRLLALGFGWMWFFYSLFLSRVHFYFEFPVVDAVKGQRLAHDG